MTVTERIPRTRRTRWRVGLLVVAGLLLGYGTWTNAVPYTLRSTIEIDATPAQVWSVLTELDAYQEWNPFIVESSGTVEVGAVLTNTMRDASGETTFTPTVRAVRSERELRWLGKVGPGGLFNGEHVFLIEPIGPGRVRLTQREEFTGVLVPFLRGQLHRDTLPQFQAMNDALARRAEAL